MEKAVARRAGETLTGFKVTQEFIKKIPANFWDRNVLPEVMQAVQLEVQGGPCPYCQKPFKTKEVNNRFGEFVYFVPSCHCFRTCTHSVVWEKSRDGERTRNIGTRPGCGSLMLVEKLLRINQCTNCGAVI